MKRRDWFSLVTTVTDAIRTRANTLFGVDLSQYQNPVDFASLKKDGVKFAYLRTYGSNHTGTGDTSFEKYITDSHAQGIPTGGYFYATPSNPYSYNDAKAQADLFITKLKNGYGGSYGNLIPMLDLEDNSNVMPKGQTTLDMSVDDLLSWTDNFRKYFEDKTGVQLGLYTGYYFVNDQRNNFNEGKTPKGNIVKDMPLWIAMYLSYGYKDVAVCGGWENWSIWQYSSGGVFSGTPNQTDLDIAQLPIENILSHRAIPTENLVTQTDVETTTNTNKTDVSTSTVVVTTTTTTTWKEEGVMYELPTS